MRKSAHVLFVNADNQVLLRLRDDRPDLPYPGQWDLVGGAVEAGETLVEAAIREIKEEIDLDITDLEYFGEYPELVHNNVFVAPLNLPLEAIELNEGQCLRYATAEQRFSLPLVSWVSKLLDDYFRPKGQ